MKNILVVLLASFTFQLYGQKLTNKEVYDYLPGDIFQHVETDFPQPNVSCAYKSIDTYYTDSIFDKKYSMSGDTIFYTDHYTIYTPLQCDPQKPPIYIAGTKILTITNLNLSATHYSSNACPFSRSDSFYVSKQLCNADVWEYHTNKVSLDSCFESTDWSSVFVKGCGGPFVSYGDGSTVYTTKLIYYKKGNVTCGNLVTSIVEQNKITGFLSLFPNPSDGKVRVNYSISNGNGGQLIIYDFTGSVVETYRLPGFTGQIAVNETNYKDGAYLCKMIVEGKAVATEKFIIVR